MSRRKNVIPNVDIHLWMPIHIVNAMDALLTDPVYGKPRPRARMEYICGLIVQDLREKGLDLGAPPTRKDT